MLRTQLLLSEGDLLTNFVDTAVVSANSNSARIMFVRAGPPRVLDEHRMRTVDIYWHPVQVRRASSYFLELS
jgi:hypothetical protein